jgi:hypothetical protein
MQHDETGTGVQLDEGAYNPEPDADSLHTEAADAGSQPITDINELDLAVEPLEQVDVDQLEERMTFAPSIPPGYHTFRFALDDKKPIQSSVLKGKTCFQINFSGTLINPDESEGRKVNYCRANSFRSGKMTASRVDELILSLSHDRDLMNDWQASERKPKDALGLLQRAESEQRRFRGRVIWRHFDKATGEILSSNPQKPFKKGDGTVVEERPWPRDAQGKLARHPGNEEINQTLPVNLKG